MGKTLLISFVFSCCAASITGCSMVGLDAESKFACKAPAGVSCKSVSGIYANAIENNLPGQRVESITGESTQKKDETNLTERTVQLGVRSLPYSAPAEGRPLISDINQLRIWVAPYEDKDHALNDQKFIYVVTDNGQWMVERSKAAIKNQYRTQSIKGN